MESVSTPTAGDAALLGDILRDEVRLEFLGEPAVLHAPEIRETIGISRKFQEVLRRSTPPPSNGGVAELDAEEQALHYMELAAEALVICRCEVAGKALTVGTAGRVVVAEMAKPGASLTAMSGTLTGEAWLLAGLPELRAPEPGETPGEAEEAAPAPETANRPS